MWVSSCMWPWRMLVGNHDVQDGQRGETKNNLIHPAPDELEAVDADDVGRHVDNGGRSERCVVDGDGQVLLRIIPNATRQVK